MAAPIGMAPSSISIRIEWFGAGSTTSNGAMPRYVISPLTRCRTKDQSSAAMTGVGISTLRSGPTTSPATASACVMDARSDAGVRQRHYLKGSLWCGESRMVLNRAIGRRGGECFYYFCRGHHSHVGDRAYLNAASVEASVLSHYAGLRLSEDFVTFIRDTIAETLADEETASDLLRRQLQTELERIDKQEENLLDLAAEGELATPKVRRRLNDLEAKRLKVQGELDRMSRELTEGGAVLNTALDLFEQPQELYRRLGPKERRVLNLEIFDRIYIDEHGVSGHVLREPYEDLVQAQEVVEAQRALGRTIPFTPTKTRTRKAHGHPQGNQRPTSDPWPRPFPVGVGISLFWWS